MRDVKQNLVSEVYLERLLTSRVPAAETVLGALLWSALTFGFVRDVGSAMWTLSALVGLPLTLRLAERPSSGPRSASVSWLRALAVPVAMVSSLSLFTDGPLAFLLAVPWLGLTMLVGLTGLMRFLSRATAATAMTAMDIGLLSVGLTGGAFICSRVGVDGVAAVELHALVFLVPVVAAHTGDRLGVPWWLPALTGAAVPVAAAGTSVGGPVEVASHVALLVSGLVVAGLLFKLAGDQTAGVRVALVAAALCLVLGLGALVAVRSILPESGAASRWVDVAHSWTGPVVVAGYGVPVLLGLLRLADHNSTAVRRMFFHLGPPTREQRSRLAEDLHGQTPKGDLNPLASEPPAGYRQHRLSRAVADFENSCEALWTWAGHEAAGIELTPVQPPILMGQNLVFTVPVGPFSITATGRVTALISDEDHYGLVVSTLDHHPLVATEAIILDKSSGPPTVTISTVWRPNCVGARVLGPLGRWVLRRTTQRYLDGIAEAETAAVGAHMIDLISEVSKRQYAISRESIRAESGRDLLGLHEEPQVSATPLSEFEAFFAAPFADDAQEPDVDSPVDPATG